MLLAELLDDAGDVRHELTDVRLLLARSLFHSAQLDGTITVATELLEHDPNEPYAHLLLGRALSARGAGTRRCRTCGWPSCSAVTGADASRCGTTSAGTPRAPRDGRVRPARRRPPRRAGGRGHERAPVPAVRVVEPRAPVAARGTDVAHHVSLSRSADHVVTVIADVPGRRRRRVGRRTWPAAGTPRPGAGPRRGGPAPPTSGRAPGRARRPCSSSAAPGCPCR